jgi:signal transduction histidine kinase
MSSWLMPIRPRPESATGRRLSAAALTALLCALAWTASVRAQPSTAAPDAATPTAQIEGDQRRILLLAEEDLSRPAFQLIVNGFREMALSHPRSPGLYFESLDAARFDDAEYVAELKDWLDRKYRHRSLDLIVPLGEAAVGFLVQHKGEPWPNTPVLFVEVGGVKFDVPRDLPNAAGVILEDHFEAALRVVKQILPATERVALVYGGLTIDRNRFGGFPEKVRSAGLGLEPIVLSGLSMDEILSRVANLPERTVIYILVPYMDSHGRALSQNRVCELISLAANSPSFSMPAHDLGCGVVGGLVRDFATVGRLLGEQALVAIENGSARPVGVPIERYTTLAFDARQLARWRIDEVSLPAGSIVQFREPSLWREHRPLVLAALTVAALQALLIGALLFEHRRRRRAELTSRQHLAAVAHLDRRAAMGELTTSLAHELNQPLNAILQNAGAAEMMLASKTDERALDEIRAILADIRSDDVRAGETIRRMRGLLRKQEIETRPLDLNDFTRDTIALVKPDAAARRVRLDADLGSAIAPVLGDRIHLQQVLLNLLLNGMEAMSATPPERRQLVVRTAQTNGMVEVSVRDAGTGIADGDPARVFEPFYTTKHEGMGMGLSIARSIIEAHRGRISAENNSGGGATVRFQLPALTRRHEGRDQPVA